MKVLLWMLGFFFDTLSCVSANTAEGITSPSCFFSMLYSTKKLNSVVKKVNIIMSYHLIVPFTFRSLSKDKLFMNKTLNVEWCALHVNIFSSILSKCVKFSAKHL